MRKADYITLANILNQDLRHSIESEAWHSMQHCDAKTNAEKQRHIESRNYYGKRKTHTIDLSRTIARNISVNQSEFLKACGIE